MAVKKFDLNGKKALIAGDSRYWSRYAAAALTEAGAEIAIASQNENKLASAAGEADKFGKKAITIAADMTREDQVKMVVAEVLNKFGVIDILVNAADIRFAKSFVDITRSEWDRMLDINVSSVFNTCQAVGREMLKRKQGRIINITSCLAERGLINGTAYCAAAGAVLQLTRALGLEWAQQGVTVNAIGAGWMDEKGESINERVEAYMPLKRYGNPAEIGTLITYLASDAAGFLTAEFIHVDGAAMCVL